VHYARLRGGDTPTVTVVDSPETVSRCRSVLSGQALLAVVCDGVNFGPAQRTARSISCIQLATPEESFFLDVDRWEGSIFPLDVEDRTRFVQIPTCKSHLVRGARIMHELFLSSSHDSWGARIMHELYLSFSPTARTAQSLSFPQTQD